MAYLIYGKRTEPYWSDIDHIQKDPDTSFRALTYGGSRVKRLADAGSFATKEDAQEWLDKRSVNALKGAVFEIRKAK